VIYAVGTENSGISLFVQDDRLVFDYNAFDDHTIVTSEVEVPAGASVLGLEFRRTATGGRAELVIDGERVGAADIPFVMFMMSSIGPSVGYDHGSAVSAAYQAPFPFAGDLQRVDIQVFRSFDELTAKAEAEAQARAELSRQ
jgi:arylsulfatase